MVYNFQKEKEKRRQPHRSFHKKGAYNVFLIHGSLVLSLGVALYFMPVNSPFAKITTVAFLIAAMTLKVAFHEFGHAYFAYKAGDYTVRGSGYLELNIFKYSDPMISLVFPGMIFLLSGIFLPGGAVYLNPALMDQKKKLWVDLGGIIMDICTLIFTVLVFWIVRGDASATLVAALSAMIYLSFGYILFNLLPIPPLDGFSALAELMPAHIREQMYVLRQQLGFFPLMIILLIGGRFLGFIWEWSLQLSVMLGVEPNFVFWGMSLIRILN